MPGAHNECCARVVVVDDSRAVRLVLTEVIKREKGLSLAGVATNGQEAVSVVAATTPDVVVLDIEMPVLDGLGALRELKRRWPRLPVVMFSTLTERGAEATLAALAEGADDYAMKPTSSAGPIGAFSSVRRDLVPRLLLWGGVQRARAAQGPKAGRPALSRESSTLEHGAQRSARTAPGPSRRAELRTASPATAGASGLPPTASPRHVGRASPVLRPRRAGDVAAIVIGSSTGGPNALAAVVPQLPADLPLPVLVVQHMPPIFTRMLAERLDAQSALHVEEARPGVPVRARNLYVAPGGLHMVVERRQGAVFLELDDGPPENFCKPSVDVLFRSAASAWGSATFGVVLTGMGQDGLVGAAAITGAGGEVIAQDEATSVVWGMPGAVAKAGLASELVPLGEVAGAVLRRVRR